MKSFLFIQVQYYFVYVCDAHTVHVLGLVYQNIIEREKNMKEKYKIEEIATNAGGLATVLKIFHLFDFRILVFLLDN